MEGHLRGRFSTPKAPRLTRRIRLGISQYLATAANAFDHAVKRRVLTIDWIVRIIGQVLLRGHLIGPRLAVADRCLRQQLLVRVRRWRWCGWISRTNRLRNRRRSVDQGQQRYRRDQLSHDGSPELGPLSRFMVAGRLDHKVPNLTFRSDVPSALARPRVRNSFPGYHSRNPHQRASLSHGEAFATIDPAKGGDNVVAVRGGRIGLGAGIPPPRGGLRHAPPPTNPPLRAPH